VKLVACVVAVAGCTSSPPRPYGTPLACREPASSVCPGAGCPTIDALLHDSSTCGTPASGYAECGGWTIISFGDMTGGTYYFDNGALVAFVLWTPDFLNHCTIGPASFTQLGCDTEWKKLPACP
jgi:hypothetical protein